MSFLDKLKNNKGNSLLETLLYIAIAAMIIMVLGTSVQGIFQIRVKNQTVAEVEHQAVQVIQILSQTIRNAEGVVAIVDTGTPIQDIKIQRGQADIANLGGTHIAPTDFETFASMDSAFVLNQNNRYMNSGPSGSAINRDVDDMSGAIRLTDVSTINFYRDSTSITNLNRFHWEAWEYVGPVEGANEFVVRGRFQVSMTSANRVATDFVTACNNRDKCIPFITGILNSDSSDDADDATSIAWMSADDTVSVERGGSLDTTIVYGVVVEFTGSNWSVAHGRTGDMTEDTGTINLFEESAGTAGATTYNVSDWTDTIIFHQFKADDNTGNDALADTSATYFPGVNPDEVDWYFDAEHNGVDNQHMVHILENQRTNVTRFINTGSLAGDNNINIASAGLTDMSNSAIVGSSGSSGSAGYGRGWKNIYLTSLTNASAWAHRSGNTISTRVQVIDVPNTAEAEELEIAMVGGGTTKFGSEAGRFYIDEGSGKIYLSSDNVYISRLSFGDLSRINTPGLISFSFDIAYHSSSTRNEFQYDQQFKSSASILTR